MHVKIVSVIPLSKSLPKDHLDYFSTKNISVGDIVEISIQTKTHKALVIHVHDAQSQKAELKDAHFQLKAIKNIVGSSPFSPTFLATLHQLKPYYIGTTSQIFSESISHVILQNLEKLQVKIVKEKEKNKFIKEKLIFQKPWNERIALYKTIIRESFAKGESIRFIAPTIQDIKLLEESLSKGIQEYCVVIHSKKTQHAIIHAWKTITEHSHPICIIQTSQFLCVPRHDVGTIILEKENSHHYQQNRKPYIDGRILTELYAHNENIKLIMSDTLLRTETLIRYQNQELMSFDRPFFRIQSEAEHIVVDMRKEENTKKIISDEVYQAIKNAYQKNKKIILFALRSGLATTTICNDCGTTQTYKNTPLTLHIHKNTGERFFKSKKYGKEFRSNIICQHCGSWNLQSFGIGTETIKEELKTRDEKFNIITVDQNHNYKPKEVESAIELFESSKQGAILITSQLGLSYISQSVDMSCIISFDTLFNIPQFNMYEKITHIVMDISSHTKELFFIQTRYKDQKITSILQSKKLFDFFEYDTEERKFWEYPPFSVLIKMSYEGPTHEIASIEHYIKQKFKDNELFVYHTKSKHPSKSITTVILKISSDIWTFPWKQSKYPEKALHLRNILELFPPSWSIEVNPQSIL